MTMLPEENKNDFEGQENREDISKEIEKNREMRMFNHAELKVCAFLTALLLIFTVGFLLPCFVPTIPDSKYAGLKWIFLLFGIASAVGLFFILRHNRLYMMDNRRLDDEYQALLPPTEAEKFAAKRKKTKITRIGVLSVVAACVIIPLSVHGILKYNRYAEAVDLAFSGAYEDALTALDAFDDDGYRDSKALEAYCRARLAAAERSYGYADSYMRNMQFSHLNEERQKTVEAFRATVEAESKKEEEAAAAREEQSLETRIRTGVPFVGMSESRIADTSLGAPYPVQSHDSMWEDTKEYETTIYYFLKDNALWLVAECGRGSVITVWQGDDIPKKYSRVPSKKGGNAIPHTPSGDPYDVEEYDNADDFYYDHPDGFYDYEDAEDYFDAHQD